MRGLKIGDLLLMLTLMLLSLFFFLRPLLPPKRVQMAEILCARTDEIIEISLREDSIYRVDAGGLTLTVTVSDGQVSVERADCRDQICVHSRPISHAGQSIVCAPAGVVIRIVGEEVDADAISG